MSINIEDFMNCEIMIDEGILLYPIRISMSCGHVLHGHHGRIFDMFLNLEGRRFLAASSGDKAGIRLKVNIAAEKRFSGTDSEASMIMRC